MVEKYMKKPVIIQAIQYTGKNIHEVIEFTGIENVSFVQDENGIKSWYIKTLEGSLFITVTDYIIKGIKGEFYPCKPDIFKETYERVILQTNV